MVFDWSINLATIIQTAIFVGGIIALYAKREGDLRIIRHDIKHLEEQQGLLNEAFSQLGSILTQVAVQDNRLNMIEKVIDELRHGEGFVRRPIGRSVSGKST